jgi:hypothetical protein
MTVATRRAAASAVSISDDDHSFHTNTNNSGDSKIIDKAGIHGGSSRNQSSKLSPHESRRPISISPMKSYTPNQNTIVNGINNNSHNINDLRGRLFLLSNPRYRAVLWMSLSLTVHLAGYELSRAAVMALFTSDGLGFDNGGGGGLSALPMAVGFVSPFSIGLLWFYGTTLDRGGPSYALRTHTLICAGCQIASGWALKAFDDRLLSIPDDDEFSARAITDVTAQWSRALLFLLFVFQNAYVQLLYNQHWAFISSVLTPEEGTRVFAPIAGLGSIGSTLAAGMVSALVGRLGLIGLLHLAGASFVISAVLADVAFGTARRGGFEPKKEDAADGKKHGGMGLGDSSTSGNNGNFLTPTKSKGGYSPRSASKSHAPSYVPCREKGNIFQQARVLFRRVPVLGALFLEVVFSQFLSSLVNFIYLYKLKSTITDDEMRAGWSGTYYAWINGVSGILQFLVIPLLLRNCKPHRIWLFMPTLMLFCTSYTFVTFRSSGLFGASASFFAIKTMEYSLRGAANEMLYVSLDYESRYLGKKVISLIAGKFGKSVMAVALSLLMVMYGDQDDTMWYLVATSTIFTFLWLFTSMSLHSLIEANK